MKFYFWISLFLPTSYASSGFSTWRKRPDPDSGCLAAIKNYGCYCSQGRIIPGKCGTMFDQELLVTGSGFPAPIDFTYPTVSPELEQFDMLASRICTVNKYCEIKIKPANANWKIIDWCMTTGGSPFHTLQLLGPPHSPVCCDTSSDDRYTMICMRKDKALLKFVDPFQINLYLKPLPRSNIDLKFSFVLVDKVAIRGVIPDEFKRKTNTRGAPVKLIRVNNVNLDLSRVPKWEDLPFP